MNRYMPEGALISTLKNNEYTTSLDGLMSAYEKGVILEAGVILCDHNFNLHVDLGPKIRAIMPRDEVQYVSMAISFTSPLPYSTSHLGIIPRILSPRETCRLKL